jgi:KilA-N domain/T5orf172 domain
MSFECKFCNSPFKNPYTLKIHENGSKKCLKKRGLKLETNLCVGCNLSFFNKYNLKLHEDVCRNFLQHQHNNEILEKNKIINELKTETEKTITELKDRHSQQVTEIKNDCLQQIKKLEEIIINITKEAINRPTTSITNNIIDADENEEDHDSISDTDTEVEKIGEYKLQPLDLGNNMYIENREDGYIDITNLCKAGGKIFNDWHSLDRTKEYLKTLSNNTGIMLSLLVIHQADATANQATWVHPYVAVNIAQWISPQFDVKISSWIYEVMLTGKIDIGKTKSFQQLQLENKEQKLKIQQLTKKYVKSQPRIQYTAQNVIYILTTPTHKNERKYILGKASNLTNRLSVYNKTDEHEVVYYQSCGDEETMTIIEQLVFQRLKEYREQANRERFILPEGKTIDLFIDVIKKTIGQ